MTPLATLPGLVLALAVTDAAAADMAAPGGAVLSVPVISMQRLRFHTTTRQQYDFSCGSAAVATLLSHHYHYPASETAAFQAMWAAGDQEKIRREGFSMLDMQRYLASIGFQADGFRVPLQTLVDKQVPAIVLIQEKGYHHFVVIKGADDGRILLGDPSSGTRAITRARFESIWPTRLFFVIHGGTTTPTFNAASDWRAAPSAPLGVGVERTADAASSLPKFGPGDF